jgi:hypothetical protein
MSAAKWRGCNAPASSFAVLATAFAGCFMAGCAILFTPAALQFPGKWFMMGPLCGGTDQGVESSSNFCTQVGK